MDDFSGSCGSGRYPLLSAVSRRLGIQHTPPLSQTLSYDHLLSRQVSSARFGFDVCCLCVQDALQQQIS